MITCIAYCRYASISPIIRLCESTRCAPAQMIRMLTPFITNISAGIMKDMALLTNILIFFNSSLASSKRSSSVFSVVNALMTSSPVKRSFMIRLIRSSFSCKTLNFGRTRKKDISMITTITASATPTVQERETLVRSALMTAPIPMIGAKQASLSVMTVVCCTICTSLVERVIRDAVENSDSSAAEKSVTLSNSAPRIFRAEPAAVLADK